MCARILAEKYKKNLTSKQKSEHTLKIHTTYNDMKIHVDKTIPTSHRSWYALWIEKLVPLDLLEPPGDSCAGGGGESTGVLHVPLTCKIYAYSWYKTWQNKIRLNKSFGLWTIRLTILRQKIVTFVIWKVGHRLGSWPVVLLCSLYKIYDCLVPHLHSSKIVLEN